MHIKDICITRFEDKPQELLVTFDRVFNHISANTGYVKTLKFQRDHYDRIHQFSLTHCPRKKKPGIGCASWSMFNLPKYLSELYPIVKN